MQETQQEEDVIPQPHDEASPPGIDDEKKEEMDAEAVAPAEKEEAVTKEPKKPELDAAQDGVEDEEKEPGRTLLSPSSVSTGFSEMTTPPPKDDLDDDDAPSDEEREVKTTISQTPIPLLATAEKDMKKYKTKVVARLAKAFQDAEPGDHRSPELIALTTAYQNFRKSLRGLVASAKAYHSATQVANQARTKLFREYASLSTDTPLFDQVGKLLDADSLQSIEQKEGVSLATTSDGLELQAKPLAKVAEEFGATSLSSIQQVAVIHEQLNTEDFQEHVLDYIAEWEEVVTTIIDQETRRVKKLQRERVHYEKKVDSLRRRVNSMEAKGKETSKQGERLNRNEQKLKNAWESHEQRAGKLCVLLEQVTKYGWMDLYPLVKNSIKWELNRLGRENVIYGRLPSTLDSLKSSFQQHT